MAQKVADALWEMLVNAGVKRCYGIVGDALNPVIDALRRNGNVDFVHVRNEEYGALPLSQKHISRANLSPSAGQRALALFTSSTD
jgi:glyoxylate carboligase